MGDFCWQAAGGWTYLVRLQHSKGINPPLGAETPRWWQEAQEEELHHSQKEQAQEEEGQLAVLKYHKVDENGKITRLRRECPNKACGAGVFMASHFDRQYCGKCNLTYVFNKPGEEAEA